MTQQETVNAQVDASPAVKSGALLGLLWDAGIPVITFYSLHFLGATDWTALLSATVVAGIRLVWVALRNRRITWFAAMMMLVFGVGLALSFVTGDPRFMLAKGSATSTIIGGLFLVSLAGRPLTLIAFQTWRPADADALGRAYQTDPAVRTVFRRGAWAWGLGMLGEAIVRIPLIYQLPLTVAVGATMALKLAVIGTLVAWTVVMIARLPSR